MPFVRGGEPPNVIGRIGSGLPYATFVVEPEMIVFLKRGLEDERAEIDEFIHNGWVLAAVPAPGADPCSEGVAEVLSRNGQAALDAARGYVGELTNLINSLEEAAKAYGLVDDANAATFGREPG